MNMDYLHVITSLFLVILCIWVVIYMLKKVQVNTFQKNQYIKIIHSLPIGPKEKILLVEVSNTYLLLGATSSQIETLYAFNELSTLQQSNDTKAKTNNFFEKMQQLRDKKMSLP